MKVKNSLLKLMMVVLVSVFVNSSASTPNPKPAAVAKPREPINSSAASDKKGVAEVLGTANGSVGSLHSIPKAPSSITQRVSDVSSNSVARRAQEEMAQFISNMFDESLAARMHAFSYLRKMHTQRLASQADLKHSGEHGAANGRLPCEPDMQGDSNKSSANNVHGVLSADAASKAREIFEKKIEELNERIEKEGNCQVRAALVGQRARIESQLMDLNLPQEFFTEQGKRQAAHRRAMEVSFEERKREAEEAVKISKYAEQAAEKTPEEEAEEFQRKKKTLRLIQGKLDSEKTKAEKEEDERDFQLAKEAFIRKARVERAAENVLAPAWHEKFGNALEEGFYGGIAQGTGAVVGSRFARALDWAIDAVYFKIFPNEKKKRDAAHAAQFVEGRLREMRTDLVNNSKDLLNTAQAMQAGKEVSLTSVNIMEQGCAEITKLLTTVRKLNEETSLRDQIAVIHNEIELRAGKIAELQKQKTGDTANKEEVEVLLAQENKAKKETTEKLNELLKIQKSPAQQEQRISALITEIALAKDAVIAGTMSGHQTQAEAIAEELFKIKQAMKQLQASGKANLKQIQGFQEQEKGLMFAIKLLSTQAQLCAEMAEVQGEHVLEDTEKGELFEAFLLKSKMHKMMEIAEAKKQLPVSAQNIFARIQQHNKQHAKLNKLDESELDAMIRMKMGQMMNSHDEKTSDESDE